MYSERFDILKTYYEKKLWSKERIISAIGKWITEDEAKEILKEDFNG